MLVGKVSKSQLTRIILGAKKWQRQGLKGSNILRHLQRRLGRFEVDWLAVAKALDLAR